MTYLIKEIEVRSVLTKTKIGGLDYSLNPYIGCSFGCRYCFADFMKRFVNERLPWGEWTYVKINAPLVLEREIRQKRPGVISMSTVTDPYQPIEATYEIARGCLQKLRDTRFSLSVLTKSTLVLRDLDLLSRMENVQVGMSIAFPEEHPLFRVLEGRVPPSSKRFRALRLLHEKGVKTWVFFNPVIPGVNDSPEVIRWVIENSRKAGVTRICVDVLNPYPSVITRVNRSFRESGIQIPSPFLEYLKRRAPFKENLRTKLGEMSRTYAVEIEPVF